MNDSTMKFLDLFSGIGGFRLGLEMAGKSRRTDMREIKFRGKREDNGEWVVGDYSRYSNKKSIIMVDLLEQEDYWVSSETVGQYTGLKDKNGKEIYEGDIVAFEDSDGGYEYPDLAVNTGIVEYVELGFYFTNRVAVEMDDFYIKDGRCDDIEVIGNIYENPELLEGK